MGASKGQVGKQDIYLHLAFFKHRILAEHFGTYLFKSLNV